jgi:hypothetical protein
MGGYEMINIFIVSSLVLICVLLLTLPKCAHCNKTIFDPIYRKVVYTKTVSKEIQEVKNYSIHLKCEEDFLSKYREGF